MEKYELKKKGFSLIEILVVVAVIGLLSSLVLASLSSARSEARDTERISNLNQVQTALELYYESHNEYPPFGNNLSELEPKYIPELPSDPLNDEGGEAFDYQDYGDQRYVYVSGSEGYRYILKANLETNHEALKNDFDGNITFGSVSCDDEDLNYCLYPASGS